MPSTAVKLPAVTAENLTFGVEIECFIPVDVWSANRFEMGAYHRGLTPAALAAAGFGRWTFQRDGSLNSGNGDVAVEVVSPILKGAAGMAELHRLVSYLSRECRARVNATCGFHVHVGVRDHLKNAAGKWNEAKLTNVIRAAAQFSETLSGFSGSHERALRGFAPANTNSIPNDPGRTVKGLALLRQITAPGRYQSVNFTTLENGLGTIEFRAFSGTVSALKAVCFVQAALAVVQAGLTLSRFDAWKVQTVAVKMFQSGRLYEPLAHRFFRFMTWNGDNYFGGPLGRIEFPGAPTMEQCKAELLRLAVKADAGRPATAATR
jgi:hypothetical protein